MTSNIIASGGGLCYSQQGPENMKIRRVVVALLLTLTLLQSLLAVSGCTSARQKFDDCKRYFLDEVVRW